MCSVLRIWHIISTQKWQTLSEIFESATRVRFTRMSRHLWNAHRDPPSDGTSLQLHELNSPLEGSDTRSVLSVTAECKILSTERKRKSGCFLSFLHLKHSPPMLRQQRQLLELWLWEAVLCGSLPVFRVSGTSLGACLHLFYGAHLCGTFLTLEGSSGMSAAFFIQRSLAYLTFLWDSFQKQPTDMVEEIQNRTWKIFSIKCWFFKVNSKLVYLDQLNQGFGLGP